jgi:hypothetical protein
MTTFKTEAEAQEMYNKNKNKGVKRFGKTGDVVPKAVYIEWKG